MPIVEDRIPWVRLVDDRYVYLLGRHDDASVRLDNDAVNANASRVDRLYRFRDVVLAERALGHGHSIAPASCAMHDHSMRAFPNLLMVSMIACTVAGCATRPTSAPFVIAVRGAGPDCTTTVAGRQVTADELRTIGRQKSKRTQIAQIETDMAQTPYRCIGGTIYRLQEVGFREVRFSAQSSAEP